MAIHLVTVASKSFIWRVDMGCDCHKRERRVTEADRMLQMVRELATNEKRNYIIYEYNNKTHFDAVECWKKGGRLGDAKTLVCA